MPAHFAALIGAGLLDGRNLSSLRFTVTAGSALPAELAQDFAGHMANGFLVQLWGMTELQAGLYTRPDDGTALAARSVGRPPPGAEVRIVDGDGALVTAGAEGELQARGAMLFAGYYENDAATAAAFTPDGWFRTGDLAVADAVGNISLTGRLKDVINRGAVKYNPRDVEDLLDGHPDIVQSAIVPVPDDALGERACCFVVPRDGAALTLEEICAYLAGHDIAKYKLPEYLEIVADMPMTPTRKVIKGRLRRAGAA